MILKCVWSISQSNKFSVGNTYICVYTHMFNDKFYYRVLNSEGMLFDVQLDGSFWKFQLVG